MKTSLENEYTKQYNSNKYLKKFQKIKFKKCKKQNNKERKVSNNEFQKITKTETRLFPD